LSVIQMFSRIPKNTEAQVLGKQLLRSSTSVGANYREAYRGRSKAEFIAKCGDSLRELEETTYWLGLGNAGCYSRGMGRTARDFRHDLKTLERYFLILHSSFSLIWSSSIRRLRYYVGRLVRRLFR